MRSHVRLKILSLAAWLAMFIILSSSLLAQGPDVLKQRRAKLAAQISEGILIIQSSERNQSNLLEFFVPNSDNHDFIYFTGLETSGATLIMCPGSLTYPEILYIDGDIEQAKQNTGIEHVYPTANLLPDLSNAYTDLSQMRYTQLRFKPLPSEIARVLYRGSEKKIVYFNYPRFVNLTESPPKRLDFIQRFRNLSPKYEIRDACDPIDRVRMYHDAYAVAQLREAARISGESMIECMRSVDPGMTQDQLRSIYDFSCQYQGAKRFGFPTSIRSGPNRYDEHFPRRDDVLLAGHLVTIDAGAEINHYTADIQRTFPVSGIFMPEQKKAYTILKQAQEACIRLVRPGCTMKDLQDKALEILDKEGGYGQFFYWGTSHFLGMEVHDHGNNLIPFKPGICITVEPGLVMDEFTIVLEDDVLCTEDGYEWLTEFIPREITDIERVMKEKGIGIR
ncbi:MAG: aminopeptidase P N-terminal domain-containing protein [Candidatus Aminicenantaceae bacterium]